MTFRAYAVTLPFLIFLPLTDMVGAAHAAAAPVPGAMPHDKTMTCEIISTERSEIQQAVEVKAAKAQKVAKTKKSLFGFAKTMASVMVPGAAMGLGGNSLVGSLAAQGVSQSASQALTSSGAPAEAARPAQPTSEQQARLARLDAIGAYRQCAA